METGTIIILVCFILLVSISISSYTGSTPVGVNFYNSYNYVDLIKKDNDDLLSIKSMKPYPSSNSFKYKVYGYKIDKDGYKFVKEFNLDKTGVATITEDINYVITTDNSNWGEYRIGKEPIFEAPNKILVNVIKYKYEQEKNK